MGLLCYNGYEIIPSLTIPLLTCNTFIDISLSVMMIFKHSRYNAIKTVAITMVRLPAIQLANSEFSSAVAFEEMLSIIQGDFRTLSPTWLERASLAYSPECLLS